MNKSNVTRKCKRCGKPIEPTAWSDLWCNKCDDHLTYNNSGGWDEPDEYGRY